MIDLETMGQGANAAIIAIGAVEFDPRGGTLGREFYTVVDLKSSVAAGGVIDTSTVLWWMRQSDAARREFERPGQKIDAALPAFTRFIQDKHVRIWGNGASFDNVILNSAYRRFGIDAPWKFWNDRCYRTIKNLFPNVPMPTNKTAHNALEDAKTQALHLIAIGQHTGIFL